MRWGYRNVGNYDVQAAHPLFATVQAFNVNSYWQFGWRGQYFSANNTPMIFAGGCEYHKTGSSRIKRIGIRWYTYNTDTLSSSQCRIHGRCK
jgi:hypothetical protein